MSKEQIEKRIRSLFYFLFGVIFTFLFILTSSYLGFIEKTNLRHKEQIKNFLYEGVKIREKPLFEDFMSQSFHSIDRRFDNFLSNQGIQKFSVVVIDQNNCVYGDYSLCETAKVVSQKYSNSDSAHVEILGKYYISIPMIGWGDTLGYVILVTDVADFSAGTSFVKNLLFHILPFIVLIFLTLSIYFYTEKNLIKPTIQSIIASEKLEAQQSLVRQYAHDIRSPVSVLEMLLEGDDDDKSESEGLLKSAIERIKIISNEFLSRERIRGRAYLNHVLEDLIKSKKIEFKEYAVEFEVVNSLREELLISNHCELYRVLSNLINNSIEASRADTIKILIKISMLAQFLKITVQDNGVGMSPQTLFRVSNEEYTNKTFGNGLGLSGARKWVRSLKGSLSIDSLEGVGTTVLLTIPKASIC